MFFHNFKYALKALLKNKALVIWTIIFPIVLGIFFNMAFSNLENSQALDIIDIAIVQNEDLNNNKGFKQAFDYLSDENNSNRMFSTKYVSVDEANELLEKNEIAGYIELTNEAPKVVVTKADIDQTVLKYAVEEVYQSADSYEKISNEIENLFNSKEISIVDMLKKILGMFVKSDVNIKDNSKTNLSYSMIEFYTLIAMTCIYGGTVGSVAVNWLLANMTNIGKRTAVSSTSKMKLVLSNCLASYCIQLVGVFVLLLFTTFVLKVDYGNQILPIIGLSCAGCLAGLSLGLVVSAFVKAGEGAKIGILISISMLGCFFSGMMGIVIKYVIDKNAPIINLINPANMITDGFYALYYYDTMDKFYFNLGSLLVFSAVMIAISVVKLRRQRYDSI